MSERPLNIFLTERLTAVGEDIYCFADSLIQQYQEELHQVRRENMRLLQMLDTVHKSDNRLQMACESPGKYENMMIV